MTHSREGLHRFLFPARHPGERAAVAMVTPAFVP
jgi:hypothetical protein